MICSGVWRRFFTCGIPFMPILTGIVNSHKGWLNLRGSLQKLSCTLLTVRCPTYPTMPEINPAMKAQANIEIAVPAKTYVPS